MNKKRITGGLIAFTAIVVAPFTMASECGTEAQQSGPDPQSVQMVDVVIKGAYRLPEGFRNIIEFCDNGGNMLGVTSRGTDLAGGPNGGGLPSGLTTVRVDDPRCAAEKTQR